MHSGRSSSKLRESYLDQHSARLKATIGLASKWIKPNSNIGIIGVSDADELVMESFSHCSFTFIIPNNEFLSKIDGSIWKDKTIMVFDLSAESNPNKGEFDLILFTEVLEHMLARDELIIENISKLLKPQGILIISVPNAAVLRNRFKLLFGRNVFWRKEDILLGVYGGLGHLREYTFGEVRDILNSHFIIMDILGINGYRRGLLRILNILPKTLANTILAIAKSRLSIQE